MGDDFPIEALEPLVNPIRQYHNRAKQKKQAAVENVTCSSIGTVCEEENLADVLAKIACLPKSDGDGIGSCIDRTKLVRTYSVKLRIKKTSLYKCFDCDSCFTNADFLELHEKSHAVPASLDTSGGRQDIDLSQDQQSMDESEMNLPLNVWFAGDIYEAEEENGDEMIQLDCTVEEREDNFDITFDRTKCEKTYTVKYKVKKDPVGQCDICEKFFYTMNSLDLHKMKHERFINFEYMEPKINIDSPKMEDSTLTVNERFYQDISEMDSGDILELNEAIPDTKVIPTQSEITLAFRIVPQKSPEFLLPVIFSPEKQTISKKLPTKSPTAQGTYECTICSRRFRFLSAFNVHMRIHANNRPYQCKDCHRRFISRAKLFLHSYGHAKDRKVRERCRLWNCNECGQEFSRPRELLEHRKGINFCSSSKNSSKNISSAR